MRVIKMDIAQQYERSYQKISGQNPQDLLEETIRLSKGQVQWICEMKDKFLPDHRWDQMQVLELGGGMGGVSLHLSRLGAKCTVVDISAQALALCKQNSKLFNVPVETIQMDVTNPESNLHQKFDLIIDSHLLHCITSSPARVSYLQFVKQHMERGGIFVGESMVYKKKIFIPPEYRFDEDEKILYQKFNEWIPFRKIADSMDLEAEFKACRLQIHFFYYYSQFVFRPSSDFMELPSEVLPASVRFALKRD